MTGSCPPRLENDLDYNAKDRSVVKQTVHGSHVAVYQIFRAETGCGTQSEKNGTRVDPGGTRWDPGGTRWDPDGTRWTHEDLDGLRWKNMGAGCTSPGPSAPLSACLVILLIFVATVINMEARK